VRRECSLCNGFEVSQSQEALELLQFAELDPNRFSCVLVDADEHGIVQSLSLLELFEACPGFDAELVFIVAQQGFDVVLHDEKVFLVAGTAEQRALEDCERALCIRVLDLSVNSPLEVAQLGQTLVHLDLGHRCGAICALEARRRVREDRVDQGVDLREALCRQVPQIARFAERLGPPVHKRDLVAQLQVVYESTLTLQVRQFDCLFELALLQQYFDRRLELRHSVN